MYVFIKTQVFPVSLIFKDLCPKLTAGISCPVTVHVNKMAQEQNKTTKSENISLCDTVISFHVSIS